MNIFKSLVEYSQNKIGKLYYDGEGHSFLYDMRSKEFKEITLYPAKSFLPDRFLNPTERVLKKLKGTNSGYIDRIEELYPDVTFDDIKIYSIVVGTKEIEGKKKDILRYGFINAKGYAITHATYDKVSNFVDGFADVYVNGYSCKIDKQGHPVIDGKPFDKAEFVFKTYYHGMRVNENNGFLLCYTAGKYGIANKYWFTCIPCEYDKISFREDPYGDIMYITMSKNGISFTAILEGDSVCNILDFTPKSIKLRKQFLIIEEEFVNDNHTYTKFGLLNRGGNRILPSEYDIIDIVARNIGIVSKGGNKQLLLIGEFGSKVCIDNCQEIKYGEGYNEEQQIKYSYALVNESYVKFIEYEDKYGNLHSMQDYLDLPRWALEMEHDKVYFEFDGTPNNYFAVVYRDKTKLIDLYGDDVITLVIPSECHVITYTYNEGIVGISKKITKTNLNGNTYEEICFSYINSEGKVLTDFRYDKIKRFEDGKGEASYYLGSGEITHFLDENGKIIEKYEEYPEAEPQESNWEELRDDAFEGDPDAYWNID